MFYTIVFAWGSVIIYTDPLFYAAFREWTAREITVLIIIFFISVAIGLVLRLLLEYVESAAIYAVNKTDLNSAAAERVDLQ